MSLKEPINRLAKMLGSGTDSLTSYKISEAIKHLSHAVAATTDANTRNADVATAREWLANLSSSPSLSEEHRAQLQAVTEDLSAERAS